MNDPVNTSSAQDAGSGFDWGSAGGAVGTDFASQYIGNYFGKKNASKAFRRQWKAENTKYVRAAKDLTNAGLNRILAYSTNSPSPPPVARGSGGGDDPVGKGWMAASARQAIAQGKAKEDLDRATAELVRAQAHKAGNDAEVSDVTTAIMRGFQPLADELSKTLKGWNDRNAADVINNPFKSLGDMFRPNETLTPESSAKQISDRNRKRRENR